MSKPSPRQTSRDQWMKAFPANEARRAAQFVYDKWNDLSAQAPKTFHSGNRENHITERFGMHIPKISLSQARLMGWWSYEEPSGESEVVNGELKPKGRIRKDLVYKSNSGKVRIELIFEFKKLEATKSSCKVYRGTEGMRRFVDGEYAKGLPIAFMVGMLIGDASNCVQTLRRSLLSTAAKSDLRMVSNAPGELIHCPSAMFPDLAQFDTEHNRLAGSAPAHGTMLLSHMFVVLPGPPATVE
jgi:hypothetical protein